jgi:YidC/Oxa1 family membrane protein insertase
MNDDNNRSFLIAILLIGIVIFGWQYFVISPQMKAEQARQAAITHQEKQISAPGVPAGGEAGAHMARTAALKLGGERVTIDTPTVDGSLMLKGSRFDDLRLKNYRETVDPKSPEVVLLAPKRTDYPYYVDFGWIAPPGASIKVPDDTTPWKLVSGSVIAPGKNVTLQWDNGHGLVFTRQIGVDDKYMFVVSDSVKNTGSARTTLYPYASVVRDGVQKSQHYWVLHEGFIGVASGTLKDANYDDFKNDGTPPKTFNASNGWVGITDKYWMAAVIPPPGVNFDAAYRASPLDPATKAYQADYRLGGEELAPGGTIQVTHRLFAGAKVVDILRHYEHRYGISNFDYAVDWGWFIFFTQPLFWVLDQLYHLLGNFGLAILALTALIRLALFPLANASFKSMSKMKKVQPEMQRIQERFADDKVRQQQEIMELYKREKVNPVSGCLPLLIQMPILFSLYKVFIVTIEMYHAPFYGWIKDLSAPDPTSWMNLFGLLPYHIPSFVPVFLTFGIWPILMGITQWVQTKMNPAPTDPVQARMFAFMPLFMTAMFSSFPAGLIIYYTWNNLLSVTQQYIIMRRQGVPVHLIDNMKMPAFLGRLFGTAKVTAGE